MDNKKYKCPYCGKSYKLTHSCKEMQGNEEKLIDVLKDIRLELFRIANKIEKKRGD